MFRIGWLPLCRGQVNVSPLSPKCAVDREVVARELQQAAGPGAVGHPHQGRRNARIDGDLQHILMQRRRSSQELRLAPALELDQARVLARNGVCAAAR